jgi:acyl-CoA reductase-like NAD-dependent aldehyde dehydrogenase
MALMDEAVWRGKIYSGGWVDGSGGDAAVISTGIVHINEQTVDDEPNIPFGGLGASGTGARFGGTANLEAFTDTRWVTIRGDIAPYPF